MFDPQNLSVVVIGLAIAEIVPLLLVVDVVMRPRSSQDRATLARIADAGPWSEAGWTAVGALKK